MRTNIALIAVVAALCLLNGCHQSYPSPELAEKQLKERVQVESDKRISMVRFKKTNAQQAELLGIKLFVLEYEAEIVFLEDCVWYRGWSGQDFPGTTKPIQVTSDAPENMCLGEYLNYAEQTTAKAFSMMATGPGERKKKGDRFRIKGDMVYEKTERGWALTGL